VEFISRKAKKIVISCVRIGAVVGAIYSIPNILEMVKPTLIEIVISIIYWVLAGIIFVAAIPFCIGITIRVLRKGNKLIQIIGSAVVAVIAGIFILPTIWILTCLHSAVLYYLCGPE